MARTFGPNDDARPDPLGLSALQGGDTSDRFWAFVEDWDLPSESGVYDDGVVPRVEVPVPGVLEVLNPLYADGRAVDAHTSHVWVTDPNQTAAVSGEMRSGNRLLIHARDVRERVVVVVSVSVRADGSVVFIGPCVEATTWTVHAVAENEGITGLQVIEGLAADRASWRTIADRSGVLPEEEIREEFRWEDLPADQRQVSAIGGTPQEILDGLTEITLQLELDPSWNTESDITLCTRQSLGWGLCARTTAGFTNEAASEAAVTAPDGRSLLSQGIFVDPNEDVEFYILTEGTYESAVGPIGAIPAVLLVDGATVIVRSVKPFSQAFEADVLEAVAEPR